MKSKILISLIAGAFIGSLATVFTMRRSGDKFHAEAGVTSGAAGELSDSFDRPLDMNDKFERDVCISFWYQNMDRAISILELQTGHKFKIVPRLSANPERLLEEQAAFMKEFMAESERQLYPKENPAEQKEARMNAVATYSKISEGMTFREIASIVPAIRQVRGFAGEHGGVWHGVPLEGGYSLGLRFEHSTEDEIRSDLGVNIKELTRLNLPPGLSGPNSERIR